MSDIRQRKVGDTQAETKDTNPASQKASATPKKTSSLAWLLIGGVVLLAAISFAYTNLSNAGNVVQDAIKQLQIPKGLQDLQEKWKGTYLLTFKDGTVSLQSLKCTPNADEDLNELTAELGKNVHGIYGFALDDPICQTLTDKGLEYISKNLAEHYKTLQRLSLNLRKIDEISNAGLKHLGKALDGGLPNLNDLRLTITNNFYNTNITDEGFGYIADALSGNLKNLKTLFIHTTVLTTVTDVSLSRLAAAIDKNHRTLSHLVLEIRRNANINGDGLVDMANSIENLKDLEILTVNFDLSMKVSNEGFQQLVSSLEQLPKLKSLSLSFHQCEKISVLGFKQLAETLTVINLRLLNLNFGKCIGVTDQVVKQLSAAIRDHQHHLEQLSLAFTGIKSLSNESLEEIATAITEKSSGLKEFGLDAEGWKMTNVGIEKVLAALHKHCKKLEKLSFNLKSGLNVSDVTLKRIAEIIPQSLTHLKELSFSFAGSDDMRDAGLVSLFTSISQHLSGLKFFKFVMIGGKITDQSVQALASGLKNNLHNLENLALTITAIEALTDASIISVSEALQHQSNLKVLEVDFGFNPRIKDQAIQNITAAIGSYLPKLEVLTLECAKCGDLTDHATRTLPLEFAKRTNTLNKVILNFSMNPKISDLALTNIATELGSLHGKIQRLILEFISNPRRQPGAIDFAKKQMQQLPAAELAA
jgi:hypothetical protein